MGRNFIKIGKRKVGFNKPVFIIAEAGVNHNGSFKLAKKLIDAAAKAGADAIKFQTFRAEQVVTASGKMAEYQRRNLGAGKSQLAMLKGLELKERYYPELIKRAKAKKIIFFSTPHGGPVSVDLLQSFGTPAFKFGSGDLTNLPLLQYAAKFKKPMIISTGMATLTEVEDAVSAIKKAGNNKIVVLHCTTSYPCPPDEVNLRSMRTIVKKIRTLVGYSDHTANAQASLMAATLGACIIEKHFTLDRALPGPDQKASMEPAEFKQMVEQLKNINSILGSSVKKPSRNELRYLPIVRKSIVAARNILKGERLTEKNLTVKRPGTGLEPKYYFKVLGSKAVKNIKADVLISKNDFQK
ncbi:MAG: N-acetylneuraminate synthase [Candidatus Yanofskybacteria bacterium]|nr:N-acetylneuraminate synthase [Candidatus Yanofskybacteria bacterium]